MFLLNVQVFLRVYRVWTALQLNQLANYGPIY